MKTFSQLREELQQIDEMAAAHTAGNHGEDKTYGADYDSMSTAHHQAAGRVLSNAEAHAKKKGYKINHENHPDHPHNEHKNPDITFHTAHGDDSPHAYTVHHKGAAAHDGQLHHKKYQY